MAATRLAILGYAICLLIGRHPLHTTHTDLVEGAGGRVTITVRSFSDDLRAALVKRERVLDDSAIARYVRGAVEIRDQAGRPRPLAWDGIRQEGDITLLALHVTLGSGLRGASVRQAMQMELYGDQVNVLQASYAGTSTSLLFLPGDGLKPLP